MHALDRPELKDPVFQRVSPARLDTGEKERPDFFAVLREGDVLVHHPYDSFRTTVEEFIRQASVDPHVLAIKMTLYRTSGDSPIVRSLIRAAERGKQVAVLVELKARFDEGANIEWAKALETAGVHVVYGLVGLKVHTKTALVVRDEPDGIRRYCHIGTGNYNSKTARIYEDVGLLTCDPDIGADLTQLFNFLTGYGRDVRYQTLLVSPHTTRAGHRGAHRATRSRSPRPAAAASITLKMNSLVDAEMIDALYEASQAGVRGRPHHPRASAASSPGCPGLSEHIRVRSIVGRYLEHSRIYRFANGAGPGGRRILIGSADLMPRNLDRRVEALVPVDEPELQARLEEILEVNLADDTLAWVLDADGALAPRRRRAARSTPTCACRRSPAPGPAAWAEPHAPERWRPVHLAFTLRLARGATGASYGRGDDLSPVGHLLLPQGGHPVLKKKRFAWLALLLAFGLVAAACGDDDDTGTDDTDGRRRRPTAATAPPTSRASVVVSGSSTVEPISTAVGEKLLDCSGIARHRRRPRHR